jgi:hypothetical protein
MPWEYALALLAVLFRIGVEGQPAAHAALSHERAPRLPVAATTNGRSNDGDQGVLADLVDGWSIGPSAGCSWKG